MTDSNYWKVKVKIAEETARGRVKHRTEEYLIQAVNPTDAEVQIHEEFKGYPQDWFVSSVTQTRIVKVIE